MKAKRIANVIPALTARTQFGQILRRVRQNNERFVVDKRGEPQAVIMSVQEYLRTFAADATNIIVSAHLKSGSPASLIFRLALSRYFHCFVSDELFAEYFEVLQRRKFRFEADHITESLRVFREAAFLVTPLERFAVARDADDNKVVECAVQARANYVVTGNLRDFPASFREIAVVSPRSFLNILGSDEK
jgi:putative PIN family toxin of toxin-antitoxin system